MFNTWSGLGLEWLVNAWIGKRKASILDMNVTAFLEQETDVPILLWYSKRFRIFSFTLIPPRETVVDDDHTMVCAWRVMKSHKGQYTTFGILRWEEGAEVLGPQYVEK